MPGVCLVVLILLSSIPVFAANLRGEVQCAYCNNFNGMHVELSGATRALHGPTRVPISTDGHFAVSDVAKGAYNLVVKDPDGSVLSREHVRAGETTAPLSVRVDSPVGRTLPTDSGTISVRRLTHKPPKAALKAFEQAMQHVEEGKASTAIMLLEKAVALDAQYVEALNNLGARYILVGEHDRAIRVLIQAIEIDSHSVHPYSNLSLALMATGDAEGAERAARQALQVDPSERRARYLLGMSLFSQRKITSETIETLRQTQDIFPRAQIALAMAEASAGNAAGARQTLKRYLKSNQKYMRPQAEKMLADLEAQNTFATN